jgi:hypothetical protein
MKKIALVFTLAFAFATMVTVVAHTDRAMADSAGTVIVYPEQATACDGTSCWHRHESDFDNLGPWLCAACHPGSYIRSLRDTSLLIAFVLAEGDAERWKQTLRIRGRGLGGA